MPYSKKVQGFLGQGLSISNLHVLPTFPSLIAYFKLPLNVNVHVNGCMSICQPYDELETCQGCTLHSSEDGGKRFSPPVTLHNIPGRKWLDGYINLQFH